MPQIQIQTRHRQMPSAIAPAPSSALARKRIAATATWLQQSCSHGDEVDWACAIATEGAAPPVWLCGSSRSSVQLVPSTEGRFRPTDHARLVPHNSEKPDIVPTVVEDGPGQSPKTIQSPNHTHTRAHTRTRARAHARTHTHTHREDRRRAVRGPESWPLPRPLPRRAVRGPEPWPLLLPQKI